MHPLLVDQYTHKVASHEAVRSVAKPGNRSLQEERQSKDAASTD